MPTPQLYPYKLRVQFTSEQERGLKAGAARRKRSITELIRIYVQDGLERDGLASIPPDPMPGQTAIDTEGDPE